MADLPGRTRDERTPGRTAYEAYARQTGGVSVVTGDQLPHWFDQHDAVRNAWEAVARAVLDAYAAVRSDEPGDFGSGVRF